MKKMLLAFMGVGGFILGGCGGAAGPTGKSDAHPNMPEWAMNQPPLCGVGIQKHRGNLGMTKTGAEGKGRDDLSRQLETKVKNMIKSYMAEGETAEGDFSEEQTTAVSTQLSKTTLNGSRPKKSAMVDGQYYTLVCLEPGVLEKALGEQKGLSDAIRKGLQKRAKAAHADMNKELEGYDKH